MSDRAALILGVAVLLAAVVISLSILTEALMEIPTPREAALYETSQQPLRRYVAVGQENTATQSVVYRLDAISGEVCVIGFPTHRVGAPEEDRAALPFTVCEGAG